MRLPFLHGIRYSQRWLSLSILLSTLLVGIGFVVLVVGMGDRIERDRTLALARTVASGLDPALVLTLQGESSDAASDSFLALQARLRQARSANPDFRFVYLMRPSTQVDAQMIFLVDAEAAESPDYSAPGDLYDGYSDDLWRTWQQREALVQEAYHDAWGSWVTTLAPVLDAHDQIVAVLGMDMRADAWQAALTRYRNFALAIVALVLLLEASFLLGLERQRKTARKLSVLNARLARKIDILRRARTGLHLADLAVRHTGEAFVLLDEHLRIVQVNPAFTHITGYAAKAAIGQHLPMFDDDDLVLLRQIRLQLFDAPHWNGTLWARRANGERFPLEGSVDLVRDGQGEPRHYVVVFRDVTVQKRLEDRLRELSITDALTELANRRGFDEVLEREWQRCLRLQVPISLVMIDIDHFKTFNDHYGHPAGDHALRQVAAALREAVRDTHATVTRYGGEEFAIILPGCDELRAAATAERLRRAVADLQITHAGNPKADHLTISLGTSTYQSATSGISLDHLLLSADRALYKAKAKGRNKVAVASIA